MSKSRRLPLYDVMNGLLYPGAFSAQCFQEALNYEPKSDDVIICTYPKCGSTWIQHLALYIFRKGRQLEDHGDILKLTPFIDLMGEEGVQKMPRPGAFKTHIPFSHLKKSLTAKYIFVARDPRDCCVSLYHHTRNIPSFGFWDGKFDDFFELFMSGEVAFNDYFDHLMSWYPYRNNPEVFYTTYEAMKKDTKATVMSLAKFLGQEFYEAIVKDNGVLNNILYFSDFEFMRKSFQFFAPCKQNDKINLELVDSTTNAGIRHFLKFTSDMDLPEQLPKHEFVRRGVVGDWKGIFSAEQIERLNAKLLERTKGTDIQNWFPMA